MKVLEVADINISLVLKKQNPIPETRLVCSKLNTSTTKHSFQTRLLQVLAWCQVYIIYTPPVWFRFQNCRHSLKLSHSLMMACVVESGTSSCNLVVSGELVSMGIYEH
jgi:hypothetical protein